MTRPGWDVISRDAPIAPQIPTDVGVWFAAGATAIGPEGPTLVRSLDGYEALFGDRSGGAVLYDAIDTYFREGGGKAYVSAVPTTPSAAAATRSRRRKPETETTTDAPADAEVAPQAATSDLIAALDLFADSLGPGQISVPGNVDPTVNTAILDHCLDHNRVALLEGPPAADADALTAYASTMRTHAAARYAALFCPLAVIPGVATGTTRSVGWSAIEAGIIARNDSHGLNPDVPAAGVNGASSYAIDLETRFSDADYTALNEAGVNMAQYRWGALETYGYRTLVDVTQVPEWWSFGFARLHMAIVAEAGAIAERYVFSQIDGRGKKIAQFGGDLRGMLVPFYEAGALYGETAEDAFQVNVGPAVNTPESIAAGELHAVLMVRMSPFAEYVVIEIVKVATTQAIAA